MKFPLDLKFDATKPLRVLIYAPFTALFKISSETLPTEPDHIDRHYTPHPAAISIAFQTYTHFFGPITPEQFPPLIRHGAFNSSEKLEDCTLKICDPYSWPKFDAYSVLFDYEGANGFVGEEDPEAVMFLVDEDLGVKMHKAAKLRDTINWSVKEIGVGDRGS